MSLIELYQNNNDNDFSNSNTSSNTLINKYKNNDNANIISDNTNNNTTSYSSLFSEENNETPLSKIYSKESFFDKNSLSGMLNVRGRNYQKLSIIDKMRGIQANRLNIDTDDLSLAEIYADDKLDNRTMNGIYNVTITDTYKDKKLFNAFHNLYTDGLLTEIEDTQDTGLVQKTYSELEEENIFFQKNNNLYENKTYTDNKDNFNHSSSSIQNEFNNKYEFSNTLYSQNKKNKDTKDYPISHNKNKKSLFKEKTINEENVFKTNSEISFYKKKSIEFKPNKIISYNSQTETKSNITFTIKKILHKEETTNISPKENDFPTKIETNDNNDKRKNKTKQEKKAIFAKNSPTSYIVSNNNSDIKKGIFNRSMSFGSTSDKALFKDSKSFEKKVKREKEKNLKKLEEIFKDTKIKIEILNKNQLMSLMEKLKTKQLKAKKENKILKFLKIETKIAAIKEYLNNL